MPRRDESSYERKLRKHLRENEELLEGFRASLDEAGLSPKTVRKHVGNAAFFLGSYLAESEGLPAADGIGHVPSFLGFWFIRKALWASESSLREMAASLKKLYVWLAAEGRVPAEDVEDLTAVIKEEMADWLATLTRYDDPDFTDPEDIWGL